MRVARGRVGAAKTLRDQGLVEEREVDRGRRGEVDEGKSDARGKQWPEGLKNMLHDKMADAAWPRAACDHGDGFGGYGVPRATIGSEIANPGVRQILECCVQQIKAGGARVA